MLFKKATEKAVESVKEVTTDKVVDFAKKHWYIAPVAFAAYKVGEQSGMKKTISVMNYLVRKG